MTRRTCLRLALLLALVMSQLVWAQASTSPVMAGGERCFPETGRCTQNAFLDFWSARGDIAILGLPVSAPVTDADGRIVQYFERAILEWHPDLAPPYQVQVALLGDQRLGSSPERQTIPGPCPPENCRLATETNHSVRGAFLTFWATNGALPVFGLPLTEEFGETDPETGDLRTVQYFERARFELGANGARVNLGRLGAEAWQSREDLHGQPSVTVPNYTLPLPARPVTLSIPAIGVGTTVEAVGLDSTGNMDVPSGPVTVAWYAYGARPGEAGNAVLAGHVDFQGYGPAVFYRLGQLGPGDIIWVGDEAGPRRRFKVYEVATYRTQDAPLDRIFGVTDEANLNLITCTGAFNSGTGEYDRRLVVYAQLDGVAW
jgi:sortase (surface protein transpeptidase)